MRAHRIWYGAAVIAALIIYIISNRRESLVFLCCVVVIPLVLFLVEILAMRSVTLECDMKKSCCVRQEIPLSIRVKRKNRLPYGMIRVDLTVENVMYNEKRDKILFLQPSEKKEMEFSYPVKMEDCGNVKVEIKDARCYGLMGIFCRRIPVDKVMDILVYPAQLRLNTQLVRRPETVMFGELYDQCRKGQDVSEVSGLRDYVAGDSLGSIHWKLSGKVDSLIVREFGYPSNYNILILYELARKINGQEIINQRNNAVLALTTALSYSMIELNLEHNVGRVIDGEYQTLPVYSMESHEDMSLSLLCRPITEDESRGSAICHFLHGAMRSDYTKMIYITPEYDETAVRQLSREIDLTVIQVTAGGEMHYTEGGGYSVIPVDASHYRERVHNIVI